LKKLFKVISLFFMIILIAIIIIDKINVENTLAMNFPEPLEKNGCLALTYHRVRQDSIVTKIIEHLTVSDELIKYSVYQSEFKQQIQFLREQKATFVTLPELREIRQTGNYPRNCVWISFDDVDKSVYENAFPILKEYQIPFTLFIISGHVGERNFDNHSLATWVQIKEMVDSGLAEVGSHTHDMHYLVEDQPVFFAPEQKNAFLHDLIKSKQTIEANLKGVQVVDFAYPYGDGKDELIQIIEQAGFLSAFILAPRVITRENASFWQNRILVNDAVFQKIVKPWLVD
jgi:intercellular adhesin biosynthesis polysaccharide N-deacetylase